MSEFSNQLGQLIRERKANVARLARNCGIQPPTLYQYISGKRTLHSEDELERIMTGLQLSPPEREQLADLFSMQQLGIERYTEREKAVRFVSRLPEIEQRQESIVAAPPEIPLRLSDGSPAVLHGSADVTAVFLSIISDACRRKADISLLLPAESELLQHVSVLLSSSTVQSRVTHIFSLESGRCTGRITNVERAFHVIRHAVDIRNYTPLFYYGQPEERFGQTALMPGYLLTDEAVLRLSPDCETAMLLRDPEIIACYQEQFHRVAALCHPLIARRTTPYEIASCHLAATSILSHALLISGGLCAGAFWTPEIIRKYLNPAIPDRDTVEQALIDVFRATYDLKRAGETTILLNPEALMEFARDGIIAEYPKAFITKPFDIADRRYLLEQMLRASREGWYHMHLLEGCPFPLKQHWEIGLMSNRYLAIALQAETASTEMLLDEPSLHRIFEDYFYSLLNGKYTLSEKETCARLQQILDQYLS